MCKPILPLIQDEIAHIFWKAQHITTVHQHNGDHHVKEEITELAHEEEDKYPSTIKTSELVSIHIIVQNLYNLPPSITEKLTFEIRVSNIPTMYLNKDYPPPKFC